MDGKQFDQLARKMATGSSRRTLLKGVGLAAFGALGLDRAGANAGAPKKVGICHINNGGGYNYITVSENAVKAHRAHGDVISPDFQTDPNHCGACGNACSPGQTCTGGSCACPSGTLRCGNGDCAECCTSANCAFGEVCAEGVCLTDLGYACVSADECVSDFCCGAGPRNGLCGMPVGGNCVVDPSYPLGSNNACCSGVCIDGTCQAGPSGLGEACSAGDQSDCQVGLSCCDNYAETGPDFHCVDTSTDGNNCGACGNVCTSPENGTATCSGGGCGVSCDPGYDWDGAGCSICATINPNSSYGPTCRNASINCTAEGTILSAECEDADGLIFDSTEINVNSCAAQNYEIVNCNGVLRCGSCH